MSTDPSVSMPTPQSAAEAARWDHSRLRRRMIVGEHLPDLQARVRSLMGAERSATLPAVDASSNPFAACCAAAAALYDREPIVTLPDDSDALDAMRAILRRSGVWALQQRFQRDVLALRECFQRIEVTVDPFSGRPEVTFTPVPPDMVLAVPDRSRPDQPCEVREARQRVDPRTMKIVWTWDLWSVADLANPVHRILDTDGSDVSHLHGLPNGLTGDAYPCRRADGRPILPYVIYHAAKTGYLFDAFHGREIVEGTLNLSAQYTYYANSLLEASFSQRYTIGLEVAGSRVDGAQTSIVADPRHVLQLRPMEDSGTVATAGAWASPTDPQKIIESIGVYERKLAAYAGLDPSDIQRVSGDPRSGYAIAIGREGRRESQARYAPIFRPADEELLSVTATLVNAALGVPALPEEGWRIEYDALPASPEEIRSEREHVLALLAAQLITTEEARNMLGIVAPRPQTP